MWDPAATYALPSVWRERWTLRFTPLEGLVMATRSGSVDPGLVLWLMTEGGLRPDEVSEGLEEASGLAGLAGGAGDMRDVLARRAEDDGAASLAFDVYVHRLCREAAAMTASLGGLDVLVFTGGVGEGAYEVRAAATERLDWLGVRVDADANRESGPDADITASGAAVRTLIVRAREDLEIARGTRSVLRGRS